MRDADNFFHAWCGLQSLDFTAMFLTLADNANHGSLLAPAGMRLEAAFLDALHHVIDLLFGRIYGHVDNHDLLPVGLNGLRLCYPCRLVGRRLVRS